MKHEIFERKQKTFKIKDCQQDNKLQKLMDRTVENILIALIEVCGTVLTQEDIPILEREIAK